MNKISRFPKEAYNRDIILYLVMFSYKYKNSKKNSKIYEAINYLW